MLTVTYDGVSYRATPDGTITPETVASLIVGDLLDSGEPIGPQVDEYVGVTGSWDEYPQSVIAAFLDVAAKTGKQVTGTRYVPEADEQPVTAGFDAQGNWHVDFGPEGGRFAKPGVSGAKAAVEHAVRSLIAAARDSDDGVEVRFVRDYPEVGAPAGSAARVRYVNDRYGDLVGPADRPVRMRWNLLAHATTPAYANLRTAGRETPMAQVNDMTARPQAWKRITDPAGREPARYTWGEFEVRKEFYADGPSMFTFVLYRNGARIDERNTLRQAKALAEKVRPEPLVNDMAARPNVAAKADWYEATVDGQLVAPHVRTAEPPTFMLVARRTADSPWEGVGFSTATSEADALDDAEIAAPGAVDYRVVAGPTLRTDPPPTTIRTVPKPYSAVDDEGWRHHEHVIVNDEFAGVVRQEDHGIDVRTGRWGALDRNWHRLGGDDVNAPFDTRDDAVAAVAAAAAAAADRPTDTSQTIHRPRVTKYALGEIRAKVDKLNARAERKGLTGRVEMEVGEPYLIPDPSLTEDDLRYHEERHLPLPQVEAVDVTMTATPVALDGGWAFAGVVDFATMRDAMQGATPGDLDHDVDPADLVLLHSAAGYQLPQSFKAAAVCDDCGRQMPRNKLVVAADADGNLTRLGTTCVRDVLGHDPSKLLWWSEAVRDLDRDEEMWSAPAPRVWGHSDFVTLALIAIDNFGYTRASEPDSTKSLIFNVDDRPRKSDSPRLREYREKVHAHYQAARDGVDPYAEEAAAAVEWIRDAPTRNEFDQNLRSAYAGNVVTVKLAGVAAYMPVAYRRAKDTAAEQERAAEAQAAIPNEWIGTPGDKIETTGTIRKIVRTPGYTYGSTSLGITIDTDQGTVMAWTDSGSALGVFAADNEGATFRFKGTVKAHDEYPARSGLRQTVLTRVAPVPTRAERLADQIETAAAQVESKRSRTYDDLAKFGDAKTQSEYASADAKAWVEARAAVLGTLDDTTMSKIHDAALAKVTEVAKRPEPYADLTAYRGPGSPVTPYNLTRDVPDGSTIGYTRAATGSSDPFGGPGPFTWTGGVLVAADGTRVTPEDIAEASAAHESWHKAKRMASRSRLADPPEGPEPPSPPEWTILTVPGVDTPWSDGPLDFTFHTGGYGDDARKPVTIGRDGLVTRSDGEPVEPRFAAQALRQAIDVAKRDHKATLAAEMREFIDEQIAAAEPAPPADDSQTLTPEWILAGPWPVDFDHGRTAKTTKRYRIEEGGDVYLDGKRLTDKSGDKVLLAALAHFDVPKPDPAPQPEVEAEAPLPQSNDMPERPERPVVGSARMLDVLDSPPPVPAAAEPLRRVWGRDLDSAPAAALQHAVGALYGRPATPVTDDDTGVLAMAGIDDPAAAVQALHAATQARLADAGINPGDTVTLYRPLTSAQFDAWNEAGRPDLFSTTPLASYRARFADAAEDGDGGVFTVDLPAVDVVALAAFGDPTEVVAMPARDGTVDATRYRSDRTDAADAAAGRPVGATLDPGYWTAAEYEDAQAAEARRAQWTAGWAPADTPVGEAVTLASGVKVRRTASGWVDQATGQPVHADGTPIEPEP